MMAQVNTLIIAGLVAVVALNSPWLIEGANNNCAAAERYVARRTIKPPTPMSQFVISLSDGRLAATEAAKRWPYLPSPVACAYGYWGGM